tara:strand:+ start:258 stop:464 length:207 start_codon:yes stop_codon:yes gene_type:complete
MEVGDKILTALESKYLAAIAEAEANIGVYMDNPAGIGEHPDVTAAVDSQIAIMAEAEDKLETIRKHYL